MAKGKLNLFQRIFTREIVGEVTEKELGLKGIIKNPVTLYTIVQKEKEYYCGLNGHNSLIEVGDDVEIYTKKREVLTNKQIYDEVKDKYGNVEIKKTERRYEPIKKYKILEKKLEE